MQKALASADIFENVSGLISEKFREIESNYLWAKHSGKQNNFLIRNDLDDHFRESETNISVVPEGFAERQEIDLRWD